MAHRLSCPWARGILVPGQGWDLSPLCWKVESYRWITRKVPWCSFFLCSSAVVHVPGVNDIQSSSSTSQNMSQISRQLNQSQVAWTGSRPPFPGQVWASARALPQVPRGRRAPELCSLGILALRTGQCMELELTASTTAGLLGARGKGYFENQVPISGTRSGFTAFSPNWRQLWGTQGRGRALRDPPSGASPSPLRTSVPLAQEYMRTSTWGRAWLPVFTVGTSVSWLVESLPRSPKRKAEDLDH